MPPSWPTVVRARCSWFVSRETPSMGIPPLRGRTPTVWPSSARMTMAKLGMPRRKSRRASTACSTRASSAPYRASSSAAEEFARAASSRWGNTIASTPPSALVRAATAWCIPTTSDAPGIRWAPSTKALLPRATSLRLRSCRAAMSCSPAVLGADATTISSITYRAARPRGFGRRWPSAMSRRVE